MCMCVSAYMCVIEEERQIPRVSLRASENQRCKRESVDVARSFGHTEESPGADAIDHTIEQSESVPWTGDGAAGKAEVRGKGRRRGDLRSLFCNSYFVFLVTLSPFLLSLLSLSK